MKIKVNHYLIVVLILSFFIRLISLSQSLWLDEAIQAWSATLPLKSLVKIYMPGEFNPPFIHFLLWIWTRTFGLSEISLRLPSVIAGVATVYLCYLILAKLTKNKTIQLLGTVLIALNPLLIYYSQEVRMYPYAALFTSWSMYEFLLILKSKTKNTSLSYIAATSLMFFSHYLSWFIYPTQIVILALNSKNLKMFWSQLKSIIWPLLSILLILPFLIPQLKVGFSTQSDLPVWKEMSSFSFRQLALIPAKIIIGRLPIDFDWQSTIIIAVPLLLWIYIITTSQKLSKIKKDKNFIFLSVWLVLPVIIGMIVSIKVAIFSYFRFLYIVPAFYLLPIYCLDKSKIKAKYLIISIFIAISAITSSIYLIDSQYHREDWKSLVSYIHAKSEFYSDKILILGEVDRPFWYYDQSKSQLYDYSEFESQLRFDKYIWLVKYAQPIFEPDNNTETKLKAYGFIELDQRTFRGDLVIKLMYNPASFTAYNFK